MPKKIFNADDFGISPGVNQAIELAHTKGVLNSTSIMINLKYTDEAIEISKKMPDLAVGLHVNLTNEYPVLSKHRIPLLVGKDGKFCHGFVNLLLLSITNPVEFKRQVKIEVQAQIEKALSSGIKISHLDSHRHVHMIPTIFKVLLELQEEYKIPRIRFVNENPYYTIRQAKDREWLKDGGLIKNLVLGTCAITNKLLWRYKSNVYFYSMIHTCKLSRDKFSQVMVPKGYDTVEIGIHPGSPKVDREYLPDIFDKNVLQDWRKKELETLLDKSVADEFVQK